MSAREFFWKHDVGIKELLILGVVLLSVNLIYLNRAIFIQASEEVSEKLFEPPPKPAVTSCDEECQNLIEQTINERVAQAIATLSGQPAGQTVVEKETVVKEVIKPSTPTTSYISVGAVSSTKNTDWTDVKAGEVYIDPADYGGSPQVSWEASLKVAHGNGKAFARLFDITHGIGVAGSEISVENSADYKQASSGNLNLWSGRNQYRVQIKSLNGFEVTIDAARIKIVTK